MRSGVSVTPHNGAFAFGVSTQGWRSSFDGHRLRVESRYAVSSFRMEHAISMNMALDNSAWPFVGSTTKISLRRHRPECNAFSSNVRLEHEEIGMSVAPDDAVWRGRTFDPGLVLHRGTGSSRDCSAAWAADVVQRVARQGPAASDAASLAHTEGTQIKQKGSACEIQCSGWLGRVRQPATPPSWHMSKAWLVAYCRIALCTRTK